MTAARPVCRICGGPLPAGHRVLCAAKECRRKHKAGYNNRALRARGHPKLGEEHRQQPLGPPRYRLIFDRSVVIRPPNPAPVKVYADGLRMPFQDDLNAIADHGSPGMPSRPASGWARANALTAACG